MDIKVQNLDQFLQIQLEEVCLEKFFFLFLFFYFLKKPPSTDRIHQQSTENALDLITMLEEIKNCSQNIVISSESFEKFSLMHAKKLASLLSCFQVEIVAFHRQTIDLIRSNWSQSEKKFVHYYFF